MGKPVYTRGTTTTTFSGHVRRFGLPDKGTRSLWETDFVQQSRPSTPSGTCSLRGTQLWHFALCIRYPPGQWYFVGPYVRALCDFRGACGGVWGGRGGTPKSRHSEEVREGLE